MSTILIVDDDSRGRETLEALLFGQGYELFFASSGPAALAEAVARIPDLILLDVMMPGMDGFEVCRHLRSNAALSEVPVVMVTALDDRESRVLGFDAGADDFISKPFDRIELRARIRSITRLNRFRRLMDERTKFEQVVEAAPDGISVVKPDGTILLVNPALVRMLRHTHAHDVVGTDIRQFVTPSMVSRIGDALARIAVGNDGALRFEAELLQPVGAWLPVEGVADRFLWEGEPAIQLIVRDITERKQAEAALQQAHAELTAAYDATLEGWVNFLDLRDKETEGHTRRVTELALRLAQAMGVHGEELDQLRRGALLHDIGKMGIPDSILLKAGPLTDEEWLVMRHHPVYAHDLLAPIPFLQPALSVPYCHHEKWDGSGYPQGLRGEQIPLLARIFAVVDVWDALCSDRPYRPRWTEERVRAHISMLAGTHFDPQVVKVFLALDAL